MTRFLNAYDQVGTAVRKIAYQPTNASRPGVRGVRDRPTDSWPAGRAGGLAGPLRRLPTKRPSFSPEAPRAPRRPMMEAVPTYVSLEKSRPSRVATLGCPCVTRVCECDYYALPFKTYFQDILTGPPLRAAACLRIGAAWWRSALAPTCRPGRTSARRRLAPH